MVNHTNKPYRFGPPISSVVVVVDIIVFDKHSLCCCLFCFSASAPAFILNNRFWHLLHFGAINIRIQRYIRIQLHLYELNGIYVKNTRNTPDSLLSGTHVQTHMHLHTVDTRTNTRMYETHTHISDVNGEGKLPTIPTEDTNHLTMSK